MNLDDAQALAFDLIQRQHLTGQGWGFKFDNAKRRFGACQHRNRVISLSAPLTQLNDETHVRNTLLHEIAHALVGARHGHDATWKRTALAIGCDGSRCHEAATPTAPYVLICPAGHTFPRHRRPRKPASCPTCAPYFSEDHLLTWQPA